jgi:hypothetical protein
VASTVSELSTRLLAVCESVAAVNAPLPHVEKMADPPGVKWRIRTYPVSHASGWTYTVETYREGLSGWHWGEEYASPTVWNDGYDAIAAGRKMAEHLRAPQWIEELP